MHAASQQLMIKTHKSISQNSETNLKLETWSQSITMQFSADFMQLEVHIPAIEMILSEQAAPGRRREMSPNNQIYRAQWSMCFAIKIKRENQRDGNARRASDACDEWL